MCVWVWQYMSALRPPVKEDEDKDEEKVDLVEWRQVRRLIVTPHTASLAHLTLPPCHTSHYLLVTIYGH